MTPAVEIVDVKKSYGAVRALEAVNLTVADGEFVSLLGASGCGKSTLLRIVSGFDLPTSGKIKIHGEDVTRMPAHRRPTNMVFQRSALFPHMNVFDNIAYSLKLRRWPRARIAARVEELLALVRLDGLGGRGATELSGGQSQRVALARALAAEPKVLLLDEPLSALDLRLRQQMQLELRAIQRKIDATFVFVTHDQTEALVMSDRIAIMDRGRIVQLGTPREIYTRPASAFVADFIGQTNFLQGTVVACADGIATIDVDGVRVAGEVETPIAIGKAATMSIRSEAIRVHRDCATAAMRGRVTELIYLGRSIRVGVAVGEAVIWADLRDEAQGLTVGDSIGLAWPPTAATVWACGDG